MKCNHDNIDFIGFASLIGNYRCKDCGKIIDPVEYAKLKGLLNIRLMDFYDKNPEKLNKEYRDHPWMKRNYDKDLNPIKNNVPKLPIL